MATLLEVDSLEVCYGDLQALFGVGFTLDEAQTLAVIGANGAGKSTLLRAICGLEPARGGEVRFAGRTITRDPVNKRVAAGIALVPEGRRLFASLTAEENLLAGAYRRRPGPWTLEAVYQLFPLVAKLRARPATALSGGEQQAVAIGRALMSNPRLLLLDEVSLGLAPVVVKQLYAALPQITAGGTTVLIVEQDVAQALAVADDVHCLLEGRTALQGKASEVGMDDIARAYFGVAGVAGVAGKEVARA